MWPLFREWAAGGPPELGAGRAALSTLATGSLEPANAGLLPLGDGLGELGPEGCRVRPAAGWASPPPASPLAPGSASAPSRCPGIFPQPCPRVPGARSSAAAAAQREGPGGSADLPPRAPRVWDRAAPPPRPPPWPPPQVSSCTCSRALGERSRPGTEERGVRSPSAHGQRGRAGESLAVASPARAESWNPRSEAATRARPRVFPGWRVGARRLDSGTPGIVGARGSYAFRAPCAALGLGEACYGHGNLRMFMSETGVSGLQDNLKRADDYSPFPSKGKCTRQRSSSATCGTREETGTCSPSPGQARPRKEMEILEDSCSPALEPIRVTCPKLHPVPGCGLSVGLGVIRAGPPASVKSPQEPSTAGWLVAQGSGPRARV